jgi:hypothetical protein
LIKQSKPNLLVEYLMVVLNLSDQVAKDVGESKLVNEKVLNPAKDMELTRVKDAELKPAEDAELMPVKDAEFKPANDAELKPAKDAELMLANDAELKPAKDAELDPAKFADLQPVKDTELQPAENAELEPAKDAELEPENDAKLEPAEDVALKAAKIVEELNLVKDIEEMKSKLNGLESKLKEAEVTISKLKEDRSSSIQDIRVLQEKLAELSRRGVRKVQVGFPLLFVCMVALISVVLGHLLHP